jgi:serine/threonine protein kinase
LLNLEKMMIARDTALGMYWLHKEGILHLDLKPGNLLVSHLEATTKARR